MLNRLFVLLGVLVILAIGMAFVVPRFIQWGDYRPRLESMASHAFGAEVAIEGDIHLTLLPQPQLQFSAVRVGPATAPVLTVANVSAEFSLFDFLRDQYHVTQLSLDKPEVHVAVAADGTVQTGMTIAQTAGDATVSIADAQVIDGKVTLSDARAAEDWVVSAVNGTVRLDALRGPFAFAGTVQQGGTDYGVRLSTGPLDDAGNTSLTLALRAGDGSFSLESKGNLTGGAVPHFSGDVTYRASPPRPAEGAAADLGRGDMVLEGKLEAGPDKVLLTEYTALPDENRSATRLTGAAEVTLGKDARFKAVISGGVVALPPRDATKELSDPPYELVRLLEELPTVPVPPLKGSIGLDVNELNLRAFSLRNLRLDATTDGKAWQITRMNAALTGGTTLSLTGLLGTEAGRPTFAGTARLASSRLDLLAGLWRKPGAENPLFGVEGGLTATLALRPTSLTVDHGTLTLNGLDQHFAATIGLDQPRSLSVTAHVTSIGATESAALAALLPDVTGSGSFGATFPKGSVDLSASAASLFGLAGADLALKASWEGGVVEVSDLSAGDLGGAAFEARLTAFGTVIKPELSGVATVKLDDGAPLVTQLLDAVQTPPAMREFLGRSLPATLKVELDAPAGDGAQAMRVTGQLGTAAATLSARLSAGLASALSAPLTAALEMTSQSPQLMTRQLGLGDVPLLDTRTPLHLVANIDGTSSNSFAATVTLTGGDDSISFDGNVSPGDFSAFSGTGRLDVKLGDPTVLAGLLGGEGLHVPPLDATGKLHFEGLGLISLDEIAADGVTGSLTLTRRSGSPSVSGALALSAADPLALWPALAGPASTISSGGLWPDGPVDVGAVARGSEGRIDVTIDQLAHPGGPRIDKASFGYDWTTTGVHLRNFVGELGGGRITLDAALCCADTATAKRLNGRLTLDGVALDAVLPQGVGTALAGTLSGAAAFDTSGDSLAAMMENATGSGSYSVAGFAAAGLSPGVFTAAGAMTDVVDVAPEALAERLQQALATGPFGANSFTGTFTLAGGVLRSPNLAIAGDGAQLFGGLTLALKDLGLAGRYAMTASADVATPAFDPKTAEIDAVLGGTLLAPDVQFDVSGLADTMKIAASEAELAVLEQRRLEAEARAKAEAEEKARLEAQQKAEAEAAAQKAAAEEAAEKKAADEAAKKKAADEAAKARAAASAPIDLGL